MNAVINSFSYSQVLSSVIRAKLFRKKIVSNYFDQNRFFVGFAYHVNWYDNSQFGYMSIFQQLAACNRYRGNHAARLFYFHNLNLR
ncbi:hypothetical protein [Terrimonas alba]|uniref:hypothetical protein n=1 Tax=Terrimonas alba TaxID=3349636 RepID=UPI0035F22337